MGGRTANFVPFNTLVETHCTEEEETGKKLLLEGGHKEAWGPELHKGKGKSWEGHASDILGLNRKHHPPSYPYHKANKSNNKSTAWRGSKEKEEH